MFDAWMTMWTEKPQTAVTLWTAANDAVPSVTDGVPPMWLTSMATPVMAPAMMTAAMATTSMATFFGLATAMPQMGMAGLKAMGAASPVASAVVEKTVTVPVKPAAKAKAPKAKAQPVKSADAEATAPKAKAAPKTVAPKTVTSKTAAPEAVTPKTVTPKAVKPVASKPATPKKVVSKPVAAKPAAEPATAKVAAPNRPAGLDAPRQGIADDLKRISGVGPKMETTLNDLGIYHFDQIAAWSDEQIEWVDDYLRFKGRIARDKWLEQAATFAKEQA